MKNTNSNSALGKLMKQIVYGTMERGYQVYILNMNLIFQTFHLKNYHQVINQINKVHERYHLPPLQQSI